MNIKKSICWMIAASLTITAVVTVGISLNGTAYASENKLPAKYDLRKKGLVTPVKNQSPFGSCWAFGGIAAAESSLLKAKKTTYNKMKLDLSEKHVAWFGFQPIRKKEDKKQAGEGMMPLGVKGSDIYDIGGNFGLITTIFSSGAGPIPEAFFPYRGKKGLTEYDVYKKNEKKEKVLLKNAYTAVYEVSRLSESETFAEFAKRVLHVDVSGIDEYVDLQYNKGLESKKDPYVNCYSDKDDWSLPFSDSDGDSNRNLYAGWTIRDGNELPEFSVRKKGKWKKINKAGTLAVKKELKKGHGVAMNILADMSEPGQKMKNNYINTDTWAHYTYKNGKSNHTVCIVGWDDKYSKKNFNKKHRPPKNGAWIVKNSWGAQTSDSEVFSPDGMQINAGKWGVKNSKGEHTGYFYVSYYDRSIENPQSMSFDTDFEKAKGFYCTQYDYMPAFDIVKFKSKKKIKTANVFKGEAGSKLKSISTRTAYADCAVTFEVYKLKKKAKNPVQGKKVRTMRKKFAYAGFHRVDLKKKLKIKKGEKYSVVVTEYYRNKKGKGKKVYSASAEGGFSKKTAKKLHEVQFYYKAVVNKGESYIFKDGKWTDWKVFKKRKSVKKKMVNTFGPDPQVDNFSIKAYCEM